jgi:hypothetical protein
VDLTDDLADDLELLTQALDEPGADVAETLERLAGDVQNSVDSYLGLSVSITANGPRFELMTILDKDTQQDQVHASLLVPLAPSIIGAITVTLVLYAATPGAFIDLAADLAWITGRTLAEFRLDEHRALPPKFISPTPLRAMSLINQALGVLIGRGVTPEEAERDLYARAAAAGVDRLGAAALILASLNRPATKPELP